jgi:hypothetical protein
MNQAISAKVSFTGSNVGKCMCPNRPVQAKSQCVSSKLTSIKDALVKIPLFAKIFQGYIVQRVLQHAKTLTQNSPASAIAVLFSANSIWARGYLPPVSVVTVLQSKQTNFSAL